MDPKPSDAPPNPPEPDDPLGSLREHPMTSIFFGPHGLRVGWRLAIAVSLWVVFSNVISFLLIWIPAVRGILLNRTGPIVVTPALVSLDDGISASAALLSAWVMTRIEKRSFADYGLPWRQAFAKRFWTGSVYGFAMIGLLMGLIAALHGFSVTGADLHGMAAIRYALFYFAGFFVVAMFEEFSFRGYLQSTLQLATGFWPAAVILAVIFGAIHIHNPGENWHGVVMAGCFGLLAAFTLRRTGSIWFAIGLHTFWDWGETYFYAVRDSGVPAAGHLLQSDFHGPVWLTGGTVGPEGSAIVFGVLLIAAVGVHFLVPARKHSA